MNNRRKPSAKRVRIAKNTGKALEQEVFETLRGMLVAGRLPFHPEAGLVRLHPAYYSRDREKEIIFDVSIEVTVPGATDPFLLWVWECKDYGHAIPVKIVEEFHSKLEQIGADGTKGTIVTRGTYQESTIKLAAAKKMGLARLLPEAQVDWVVHRSLPGGVRHSVVPETVEALMRPEFLGYNQDFYGFTEDGRTMVGLSLERFVRLSLEEWGLAHESAERLTPS